MASTLTLDEIEAISDPLERARKKHEYWFQFSFTATEGNEEQYAVLNEKVETLKQAARAISGRREEKDEMRKKGIPVRPEEERLLKDLTALFEDNVSQTKQQRDAIKEAVYEEASDEKVAEAVDTLSAMFKQWKEKTKETWEALDEERNKSDPVDVGLMKQFNESYESLAEFAREMQVSVPWQLKYVLLMKPTDEKADFKGGDVFDRFGKRVNEARCALTDTQIQYWGTGEGDPRYHCLDSEEYFHSEAAHDVVMGVFEILQKKPNVYTAATAKLRELEPHLDAFWVKENNIPTFLHFPVVEGQTVAQQVHAAFTIYRDRPCMATNDTEEDLSFLTFGQVQEKTMKLAHCLKDVGLHALDFIGICLENCPEWVYLDLACALNFFTSVGIMPNWPTDQVQYVFSDASIKMVAVSKSTIEKAIAAIDADSSSSVNALIYVGDEHDSVSTVAVSNDRSITIYPINAWLNSSIDLRDCITLSDITVDTAVGEEAEVPLACQKRNDKDIFSLIYSSGTTGEPKGIIESEERWRHNVRRPIHMSPFVVLSYSPLAHGMDRGLVWGAIGNGGRIVFVGSDDITIEAQKANPSMLVAMPYIWNDIFFRFQSELDRRLVEDSNDAKETRAAVLQEYRLVLGKNMKLINTGGAPISKEVLGWMRECFADIQVGNNYGTTEVPGISVDGWVNSEIEVCLKDVECMGYFASEGKGEICVRTKVGPMSPGYHNKPEQTAAAFIGGWYHTGDIGLLEDRELPGTETGETAPNLTLIDRKKNLIELYVDGESVWTVGGKIEAALSNSPWVSQIFVHGERTQSVCVAVINVNRRAVEEWMRKVEFEEGFYEALSSETLVKQVLQDLETVGKVSELKSYEIPRLVILEEAPWTIENNLLAGIGKIKRPSVLARYRHDIDRLYASLSH